MDQLNEEKPKPLIILEAERQSISVTNVAVTETAFQHYLMMLRRYQEGNYHDLMVLLGPQSQSGSVRLITEARLCLNPYSSTVFPNVFETANDTLKEALKSNPNLQVLGIGTVMGNRSDVQQYLQMGYGLYWAGGDRLYDGRPKTIDNPGQSRIYALDANRNPVAIPPKNLFPIASR